MHASAPGRIGGEEYGDDDFVDERLLRAANDGHPKHEIARVSCDDDDDHQEEVGSQLAGLLNPWQQAGVEDSDDENQAALSRLQQAPSDDDQSSSTLRRRQYVAAQGPQTAGEVYLQYALA